MQLYIEEKTAAPYIIVTNGIIRSTSEMFTSDWSRELKTFFYKVRTARSTPHTLDTTKALNGEKVGLRKAIVRFWLRKMQVRFRGVLEAVRTGVAPGGDEER